MQSTDTTPDTGALQQVVPQEPVLQQTIQ